MHIITDATGQTNTWQQQLQELITDLDELADIIQIPRAQLSDRAHTGFPLRLPRSMLAKIEKGNIDDPILRQFIPHATELTPTPGFVKDPLEEESFNPIPGLIHKYQGRVLIMATGQCAVNCRYCFRRHFSYDSNRLSNENFQKILDYIAADPTITEVIFSGGDPLAVSNRQLRVWLQQLAEIRHLTRVRIHSRLPVVIPERLDDSLLALLSEIQLQTILVIHCNHANEIDQTLCTHLAPFRAKGTHLLNQTVLLRGINDSTRTLMELSEALFSVGVLPYYLHLLDPVEGAGEFNVEQQEARELHGSLLARLPGYLVPKLVREIANKPCKTWVNR